MKIIRIEANENGSRPPIQTWSEEIAPDGFAVCPDNMVATFNNTNGFVSIASENGVVVSMVENTVAKKAWEALPKSEPEPTPDEDRDAMLADLEYRTTILELGLN